MSDDLDDLRGLLKAAPAPDGDAKARAMALAMENFDRLQGSTEGTRSSEDRTKAAPLNGVRRMFHYLTSRPALAATTSVAALIIGVAVILPVADLRIGKPTVAEAPKTDPVPPVEPVVDTLPTTPQTETAPEGATTANSGGEAAALSVEADDAAPTGIDTATPKPEAKAVATDELARQAGTETDNSSAVVAATEPEPMVEAPILEQAEETLPAAPIEGVITDSEARLRAEAPADAGGVMGYVAAPATTASDIMPAPVENTEAYSNEAPNPV